MEARPMNQSPRFVDLHKYVASRLFLFKNSICIYVIYNTMDLNGLGEIWFYL
jgi:hypothetical protein